MQDEAFEMVLLESLEKVLESAGPDAGRIWLWCIYCERFFQAKHLRIDFLGNRQGCAFCGCAGFNMAIFLWNTFREGDPDWPESTEDLHHGLRLPPPRD